MAKFREFIVEWVLTFPVEFSLTFMPDSDCKLVPGGITPFRFMWQWSLGTLVILFSIGIAGIGVGLSIYLLWLLVAYLWLPAIVVGLILAIVYILAKRLILNSSSSEDIVVKENPDGN